MADEQGNVLTEPVLEVEEEEEDDYDAGWDDWNEETGEESDEEETCCLFCPAKLPSPKAALDHSFEEHSFEFQKMRTERGLDFYGSMRLVNYIREQVALSKCIHCGAESANQEALLDHMKSANHFSLPTAASIPEGEPAAIGTESSKKSGVLWEDEKYLTPTLEGDPLLYSLDMDQEADTEDGREEPDTQERSQVLAELAASYGVGPAPSIADFELSKASTSSSSEISGLKPGLPEEIKDSVGADEDDIVEELVALKLENEELRSELAAIHKSVKARALPRALPRTPHPTPVSSPLPSYAQASMSPSRDLPSALGIVEEEEEEDVVVLNEQDDLAEGSAVDGEGEKVDDAADVADGSRKSKFLKLAAKEAVSSKEGKPKKQKSKVSFGAVAEREARGVDSSYFKSYGMFGIHREMLGDKARTGAYQIALTENPSLIKDAVVMDVGCGTGILSMFAAKAGAQKVVAIDGSDKIASVARQVAEANGYLKGSLGKPSQQGGESNPVMHVVCGMVEQLRAAESDDSARAGQARKREPSHMEELFDKVMSPTKTAGPSAALETGVAPDSSVREGASTSEEGEGQEVAGGGRQGGALLPVSEGSVDVLVSEWMGYCLLYESMLSSVLYARDKWLKPGGAMLPDTATMFMAGFGKGATSLAFWEEVYGFDMTCIGQEVVGDAAQTPLVDKVDSADIITNTCSIQTLDLATMKPDDVDFTSYFQLALPSPSAQPAPLGATEKEVPPSTTGTSVPSQTSGGNVRWCYGVVVWFDVGFTERFCKEKPTVLSTSPYAPLTHWAQTILTFKEPLALTSGDTNSSSGSSKAEVAESLPQVEGSKRDLLGCATNPAASISGRISIARSSRHRSIDISLETAAVASDGTIRRLPVQLFDL